MNVCRYVIEQIEFKVAPHKVLSEAVGKFVP